MIEISADDAKKIAYFLTMYALNLRQTSRQNESYRADTIDDIVQRLNRSLS